jgi:hypothetical protein
MTNTFPNRLKAIQYLLREELKKGEYLNYKDSDLIRGHIELSGEILKACNRLIDENK